MKDSSVARQLDETALVTVQGGDEGNKEKIAKAVETLGGLVSHGSDLKEVAFKLTGSALVSVADLVRGKQQWWKSFQDQWDETIKVNPEAAKFTQSEDGQNVVDELFESLGLNKGKVKLDAVKAIFLNTLRTYVSGNSTVASAVAIKYLDTTTRLSIGDLLILRAVYEVNLAKDFDISVNNVRVWQEKIAEKLGYPDAAMVMNSQEALEACALINQRAYQDKSAISFNPNFGLTGFGVSYCKYAFDELSV